MKLVLNIGMHKTGSSSIQQSFSRFDRDGARYLALGHPNHSAIYATMFMTKPETYSAHRKNSRSPEDVQALRTKFSDGYDAFLAADPDTRIVMSSAEDLVLMDDDGLARLRDWADARFDEVQLIGYARPPVSFMASALQQRVAGGVKWTFRNLYPIYRERFEGFDRVFGKERVNLVKFDRKILRHGDVVLDFADRAGVPFAREEVVADNESRSLETTAALQAQRDLGRGWLRYPGAPIDNHTLVARLRQLGESKIVLHPDLVNSLIENHTDDLAWMADRLGMDFVDSPAPEAAEHPNVIRSRDDFLRISGQQLPGILDLVKDEVGDREVDPQIIANAVDMLLDVIRSAPKRRPGAANQPGPAQPVGAKPRGKGKNRARAARKASDD